MSLFSFHYPSLYSAFFKLLVVLTVMYRKIQLLQWCMLRANILFVVFDVFDRPSKRKSHLEVELWYGSKSARFYGKDERKYVITLDKQKSTCTLVRFFILPTRLKFNYYQFCFNITRYNHYTFGASSLF